MFSIPRPAAAGVAVGLATALGGGAVFAHALPAVALGHTTSLAAGVAHPLMGLDPMLGMLGVRARAPAVAGCASRARRCRAGNEVMQEETP